MAKRITVRAGAYRAVAKADCLHMIPSALIDDVPASACISQALASLPGRPAGGAQSSGRVKTEQGSAIPRKAETLPQRARCDVFRRLDFCPALGLLWVKRRNSNVRDASGLPPTAEVGATGQHRAPRQAGYVVSLDLRLVIANY
jgi:hypothetical protein